MYRKPTQKKRYGKKATSKRKFESLNADAIDKMYNSELSAVNLQRTARRFFKTYRLNDLVTLINPNSDKCIKIDFNKDQFGYYTIRCFRNNSMYAEYLTKIRYNKDLFIKIYNHQIL
ncbi:hypothetical protein [Zhouia amylolytica]|uniref:hypothetical protein n=1 Tax=Zhouia amylolytica TaxID=376730 RepID=UPI0020CBE5B6|nr:hypothetical protein [Zhouia amylolytica]MCQ0113028.1 hypothetical protein [Zhouia amylolytica]